MKKNRSAFTLIELLVVVAIIALLISILLPSLSQAREQGKATVCRANLKDMGNALTMYLHDNSDWFPGDHAQVSRDSIIVWHTRIKKYLSNQRGVFWCPSVDSAYQWKYVGGYSGRDLSGWFYEPGEKPIIDGAGRGFFSYGYNAYGVREFAYDLADATHNFSKTHMMGLGGHPDSNTDQDSIMAVNFSKYSDYYVRLDQVKVPAQMIAIGDSDADGSWDGFIYPRILPGSNIEDDVRNRNWPSKRHMQGSCILYVDGHADLRKRRELVQEVEWTRKLWNNCNLPHKDVW